MPNTEPEKSPKTFTAPSSARGWTDEEFEEVKRNFQRIANENLRRALAEQTEEEREMLERISQYPI